MNGPFFAMIVPMGAPPGGGGGQPPLGIWGPTDPRPTHPIAGWDPGSGQFPPGSGGGGGQPPTLGGPGWGWVPGGPGSPPEASYPPGFSPGTPPERPRPGLPVAGCPDVPGGGGNYPGSPGFRPPGGGGGGGGQPPLGIWGPGDPRPTLPIAGWNPGTGNFPGGPGGGQLPDGTWGPGDPRPTNPIVLPIPPDGETPPPVEVPEGSMLLVPVPYLDNALPNQPPGARPAILFKTGEDPQLVWYVPRQPGETQPPGSGQPPTTPPAK